MKRLSLLDTCFLRMETVETPMHVGALLTFRLPRKGRQGYLGQLVRRMRSYPVSRAPFNYVLDRGLAFGLIPSWKIADSVDLDYHFRHSALPRPGGERELGVLISRLHSHPLDMSRPPWECHVIEGLESDRFAIYLKGHHAAIDGMGGLRLIKSWLSESGDDMETPPPWALPASTSLKLPDQRHLYALKHRIKALRTQLGAVTELVLSVRRAPSEYPNGSIATLFKAPHCALNVPISGARRFATQMLSLERIKSVAQQTGTSVNDVVLTIAGGALRRYLIELDALPRLSLLALVPVALRPRRNQTNGNSLCGLLTDLETQIADPVERLCTISASTQAGKRHVQRLSPAAAAQYSMLLMAPLTLSQISGLGSNLPPLFNLLVSNVPAARNKLHLDGAELEGIFPLSLLFRGQALNITGVGYANTFTLSFTACHNALPGVQRLAVYSADALDELEQALGIMDTSGRRVVSIHSAPRTRVRRTSATDGA